MSLNFLEEPHKYWIEHYFNKLKWFMSKSARETWVRFIYAAGHNEGLKEGKYSNYYMIQRNGKYYYKLSDNKWHKIEYIKDKIYFDGEEYERT